jgi:hypothetical protein
VGNFADSAANYNGNWTTGSNQGTGFGNWTITPEQGTGFAGAFIGNPSDAGISNMSSSFGLYANPNGSNATVSASRAITGGLSEGQSLSFQWAINFDSDGGIKGFRIYTGGLGGTLTANVSQGSFPGNITISGTETGLTYGTSPMLWTFSRTSATNLLVTATPRTGESTVAFTQNLTISAAPDLIEFYASNMGNSTATQRQPYFNNFLITGGSTPEPPAYDSWASSYGLNATVTTGPTAGAPTADPDSDSFTNQQEYAFGTNPTQATAGLLSNTLSSGNFTIMFQTRPNLTYNVQNTDNLSTISFSDNATLTGLVGNSTDQNGVTPGYTRKQFTITPSGSKNFYRVRSN